MNSLLLTGLLLAGLRHAHPDVVARTQPRWCRIDGQIVAYRLYAPQSAARPLPLVVWLHGFGESGSDNVDQLAWLELILGQDRDCRDLPCCLVATQLPAETGSWLASPRSGLTPAQRLDAMIADVQREVSIDPNRIYLAGISDGASGCWWYAARWPGRFAAILPMGACEMKSEPPAELRYLSAWAFQSSAGHAGLRRRVAQHCAWLTAHGGNGVWTVVWANSHNCWTVALSQYRALDWLLRQRRRCRASRPAASAWWWPSPVPIYLAACVGISFGVGVGWLLVGRIRKGKRPQRQSRLTRRTE